MKRKICVECQKPFRVRNETVHRCRRCANKGFDGTSDGMFNRPNRKRSVEARTP
jgi:predicted kinase